MICWNACLVTLVASSVLLCSPVPAQTVSPQGLWIRFGVGFGAVDDAGALVGDASSSRDGVTLGGYSAEAVFVRVGSQFNRWMRLGAGVQLLRSNAGEGATMTDIQLLFEHFLPRPAALNEPSRFFVMLAPGISDYGARTTTTACAPAPMGCFQEQSSTSGSGWSLGVGLGYELGLAPHVFVTPLVSYLFERIHDIQMPAGEVVARPWRQRAVKFAVGVGFH